MKTKVTKSQLSQAKRMRKYNSSLANSNKKIIAKVFNDFAKEIAKNNGIKFAADDTFKVSYTLFNKNMKKALEQIFERSVILSSGFTNNLFDLKLKNSVIEKVRNRVLEKYNKKNSASMIKYITNTTKKRINNIIIKAQKEGLNQKEIAKLIKDSVKDMSGNRARTIARTETSKAVNITSQAVANNAGIKKKKWIYTDISKVPRIEHQDLDGETIGIDEYFNVGGFSGLYPHDPNLPAQEVINCNCIVIYL